MVTTSVGVESTQEWAAMVKADLPVWVLLIQYGEQLLSIQLSRNILNGRYLKVLSADTHIQALAVQTQPERATLLLFCAMTKLCTQSVGPFCLAITPFDTISSNLALRDTTSSQWNGSGLRASVNFHLYFRTTHWNRFKPYTTPLNCLIVWCLWKVHLSHCLRAAKCRAVSRSIWTIVEATSHTWPPSDCLASTTWCRFAVLRMWVFLVWLCALHNIHWTRILTQTGLCAHSFHLMLRYFSSFT